MSTGYYLDSHLENSSKISQDHQIYNRNHDPFYVIVHAKDAAKDKFHRRQGCFRNFGGVRDSFNATGQEKSCLK